MKKSLKILSAVCLIAIVVGIFGIFASFAEDTTSDALAATESTATTVYDINNLKMNSSNRVWTTTSSMQKYLTEVDGIKYPNIVKKTDADGNVYFNYGWDGWDPNTAYPTNFNNSGCYIIIKPTESVVLKSYDSLTKNADLFVISGDFAVESAPASFILNMRFSCTGSSGGKRISNLYFDQSPEGDGYVVSYRNSGGNKRTLATIDKESVDGWINITLIIDATCPDDDTGVVKSYYYLNGNYVGAGSTLTTAGLSYADSRLQINTTLTTTDAEGNVVGALPENPNEAVSISDFTMTKIKLGENSNYTSLVADKNVTLREIPELAYCTKTTPPAIFPFATIERGEGDAKETIIANTYNELDASILPGDTVTLHKAVSKPIIVPKDGVTWNLNGFKMPDVIEVDYDTTDWVIRNLDGTLYSVEDAEAGTTASMGAQVYTDGALTEDTLSAYIATELAATAGAKLYVTLLRDVTTNTKISIGKNDFLSYDLNAYTLYAGMSHSVSGANPKLYFKNGSLVGTADNAIVELGFSTAGVQLYLENMEKISTESTSQIKYLFIVRDGGTVTFKNCRNIEAAGPTIFYLNSEKGYPLYFRFENSTATLSKRSAFANILNTYSSSSKKYYGGMDTSIKLFNSSISQGYNAFQPLFGIHAYSHYEATTDATLLANSANILVEDSTLEAGIYSVFSTDFARYTNGEIVPTGMSFDTNIKLVNTTVTCFSSATVIGTSAASTLPEENNGDYAYNVNLITENTDFHIGANTTFTNNASTKADVTYNFGENTRFSDNKFVVDGQTDDNITFNYEDVLAHTNTNGSTYDFIVTKSYNTYNYKLGNLAAVPFYWNDAEGEVVNIDKVVTLASSAAYTYSWNDVVDNTYTTKLNPAFKPQVNLTTNGTIALNMYIPEEVYEVITMDNIAVSTEYETVYELDAVIGETEYAKLSIKGIAPKDAETVAATVALTVKGAYEDEVVGSWDLSVVDYCAKALASESTTDAEKQYVLAILNYISAVYTVEGKTADAADALLAGAEFDAVALGTAKYDSVEGISAAALNLGSSINWVFKVDEGYEDEVFTFTYYVNGEQINVSRKADANGEISIGLRAYDALKDVVVNGSTVNLAGYAASDAASGENVQAAIAALAIYANEAAIYNNVALGND